VGSLGGLFWSAAGWPGVTLMVGVVLLAGIAVTLWLMRWRRRVPA
jgi:hypothetical protein